MDIAGARHLPHSRYPWACRFLTFYKSVIRYPHGGLNVLAGPHSRVFLRIIVTAMDGGAKQEALSGLILSHH